MRKFVVTVMASLLSCSAAFAFWPEATDSSLEVGVGYRQDRIEWKTSSDTHSGSGYDYYDYDYGYGDRDFRSHVKWRNLNIWQIEAKGEYVTCDNIYLRGNADYGWITSGKNTDKDKVKFDSFGSDRKVANSHSKARGQVYDARIALGYQFKMCDDSFAIAPLVGYSWHGQHIHDHHLKQNDYYFSSDLFDVELEGKESLRSRSHASESSFGSSSHNSSSYGGKHSKYHTRWNGPFIGFDFDYRFGCGCEADWEVFGTYEFHWAEYHAKGHWKLREDLLDGFRHHAKNAYGSVFDIGLKWDFCECWTVALKGEFQWFWADHGRDRAKIHSTSFGNVRRQCTESISLHDVRWQSAAVSIDLGMVF